MTTVLYELSKWEKKDYVFGCDSWAPSSPRGQD
jgi:hypothetical protein